MVKEKAQGPVKADAHEGSERSDSTAKGSRKSVGNPRKYRISSWWSSRGICGRPAPTNEMDDLERVPVGEPSL